MRHKECMHTSRCVAHTIEHELHTEVVELAGTLLVQQV